jgi:hypothetical protein
MIIHLPHTLLCRLPGLCSAARADIVHAISGILTSDRVSAAQLDRPVMRYLDTEQAPYTKPKDKPCLS